MVPPCTISSTWIESVSEVGKERMQDKRYLDMTEGNIFRQLVTFSIPLLIGMFFQQAYSLVDTMVAGRTVGDAGIAAIGCTAALYSLMLSLATGLNRGFAIVLTQAYGAHDKNRIKKSIASMVFLNLSVAFLLTTIAVLFMKPILQLLNTPEEILNDTYSYIIVIAGGVSTTIFYNMFSAMLNSFGNSRTSLYYLMLTSILNIVLDIFFMVVLHTGIYGLALGTVIAAGISALASGLYFFKNYREVLPSGTEWKPNKETIRLMLSYGIGMALMHTAIDFGTLIFQGANNGLGPLFITAHTAARRLMVIFMQPQSVMSTVLATFVGQNWGARKKDRISKSIRIGITIIIAFDILSTLLVYLLGEQLVHFMTSTTDKDVLYYAVLSLRINVVLLPATAVLCALRSSLQAMGIKIRPVICSVMELSMKVAAALFLIPRYGFLITCVTEPATWIVCGCFISLVYLSERKKLLAL